MCRPDGSLKVSLPTVRLQAQAANEQNMYITPKTPQKKKNLKKLRKKIAQFIRSRGSALWRAWGAAAEKAGSSALRWKYRSLWLRR